MKEEIIERFKRCLGSGVEFCSNIHARAEESWRYARGEQWAEGDAERQKRRERPALPLNSLMKVVNAVANREIMDRIEPKVFGRNVEDNKIASALDGMLKWQRDTAYVEHEESMAFRAVCTSGYGVIHTYWDDRANDGKGAIVSEEVPIWSMLWDPAARKQNLVDRQWHIHGKWMDAEQVEKIYGVSSSDLKASTWGATGYDVSSSLPWGWEDLLKRRWLSSSLKEVFVVEYEYLDPETVYVAKVPTRLGELIGFLSGNIPEIRVMSEQGEVAVNQEMAQDQETRKFVREAVLADVETMTFTSRADLQPIISQYQIATNSDLPFVTKTTDIVRYAVIVGNTVVDSGVREHGWSFEFLTGFPFEQREGTSFIGMVDLAKGPQDMRNAFLSNLLALYMTSPKGGIIVERDAIPDIEHFLDQYARLSGVVVVEPGFLNSGKFQLLPNQSVPPVLAELIELTSRAVQEEFGLSSIDTGMQTDLRRVTTGVATAARQASSTILSVLFDSLRRYRRRVGRQIVKLITRIYSPTDAYNILGTGYEWLASLDEWPSFDYDIKIDEAPTSVSEQIEAVDFLTRTGTLDRWISSGLLAFEDAIDLMVNIPQSVRERIKANSGSMRAQHLQIQDLNQKLNALMAFIKTLPNSREIIEQFEATMQVAQAIGQQGGMNGSQ